jgi:hypothetical protein
MASWNRRYTALVVNWHSNISHAAEEKLLGVLPLETGVAVVEAWKYHR